MSVPMRVPEKTHTNAVLLKEKFGYDGITTALGVAVDRLLQLEISAEISDVQSVQSIISINNHLLEEARRLARLQEGAVARLEEMADDLDNRFAIPYGEWRQWGHADPNWAYQQIRDRGKPAGDVPEKNEKAAQILSEIMPDQDPRETAELVEERLLIERLLFSIGNRRFE